MLLMKEKPQNHPYKRHPFSFSSLLNLFHRKNAIPCAKAQTMNAATCTNVNRVCTRFDREEHTSVPLAPFNSVSKVCSGREIAFVQAVAHDEIDMGGSLVKFGFLGSEGWMDGI